jgi:hypothetical protein
MLRIFTALLLAIPLSALADKPPRYDRDCLEKTELIVENGGESSYLKYPNAEKCVLHGTYYRVTLHMGSSSAGQRPKFKYYEETLAKAQARKEALNNEMYGFCRTNDIKVEIEPVSF